MSPCTNCGNPRKPEQGAHGLCAACYQYQRRHGGQPRPPETHARLARVTVYLDEESRTLLERLAKHDEATVSETARLLLWHALRR